MSLYVDGKLKSTAQAAGANTTSGAPFTLGAWLDRFGPTEFFPGMIDKVSVYNRALNAPEIRSTYLKSQIIYPVPELENCRGESECRLYCEKPEHS